MSLHDRDLRSHSSRTQTTTIDTNSLSRHDSTKSPPSSESARTPSTSEHATHQRFVLTDYVAFRYLEDDPGVTVLSRREKLEGYEIYLVEQWACSRVHPTFIITTYTGDPKDTAWA